MTRPASRLVLDRRRFLSVASAGFAVSGLGVVGLGVAGCGSSSSASSDSPGPDKLDYIKPGDPEVAAAESKRRYSGTTVPVALSAGAATVDLGGRIVNTWAFGDKVVAPTIRMSAGDRLDATLSNSLSADTSIHWHGVRIRNDMDGVPPVTQPAVVPGSAFDYTFIAPDPGTYWYHSHSGLQADRGLFGALVVEDPQDSSGADTDTVLVLDDWVDGLGTTPDALITALNPQIAGGHGGHGAHGGASSTAAMPAGPTSEETAVAERLVTAGHGNSSALGGMTQHITYPMHLINGRPSNDPSVIEAAPGTRLRIRIINAGAETPYRFAVAGHRLTVVAVDGYDVVPTDTDAILIGMAQRYDVLITVASGAWPVVASVEGRAGYASTVLRSTDTTPLANPDVGGSIPELTRQLVLESELKAAESVRLDSRPPDRDYRVDLLQAGDRYVWAMAGPDAGELVMKQGERVRITMTNTSTMWHPMHTHGHTFAVPAYGGLRRDTVNVMPRTSLAIEFDADNPGEWMFHCHNAYHFEAGMTANLKYIR